MRRPSPSALLLAALFVAAGSALAGYAIGHGLRSTTASAPPSPLVPGQGGCSACPAGTHLDSVEVQARQGSTLFILRGSWPATVDELHVGVCLATDSVGVVLTPHGARNLFEVTATRAGSASAKIPASSVAVALAGSVLVVDLAPPAQPTTPMTFDLALCRDGSALQRIPASGELVWDGRSVPRPAPGTAAVSPPATTQPSPSLVASTPLAGVDPAALARACTSIPGGTIPPSLQVTGFSSGVQTDPRTGTPTEEVTATLAASSSGATSPYAVAALVLPAGARAPSGRGLPVDLAGVTQLFASFDGAKLHKAIRTFAARSWTTLVDADANAMSFAIDATGVTLFWPGLHPGDHVGFLSAAESGCSAFGLDAGLAPQLVIR